MITAQNNLIGRISAKQNITGKLNNAVVREYPELEDLTVTPTANEQKFKSSKYGFDNVTVNAVESKELNIVPSAEEQIKEGLYNKVTIHGDSDLIPENIKEGTEIFGVTGVAKTISIKITNASYLFYGGARINHLNEFLSLCENITNASYMFRACTGLTDLDLSNLDTRQLINAQDMFDNCLSLINLNLSNFDTGNVNTMFSMLSNCPQLTNLDLSNFDMSKVINITNMFYNDTALTNLKSFKNLGKGYVQKTNNYKNYNLNLSKSPLLTHGSLMDVINNLYDLNLTYDVANGGTLYTQTLNLGATNLAKLTAEEIAIATNKRLDCFIEGRIKMKFFSYTKPKMIVADEGKQIRSKDDVYQAEHTDEFGNKVEEHFPHYSTTIFVPDSFTEAQMNELYVEEDI